MSKVRWHDRHTVLAPKVTLCMSQKEFDLVAQECKVGNAGQWLEDDRNEACVHTWESGSLIASIVCINDPKFDKDPIDVAATLVHESVHIFQHLCISIGEDNPSKEFEAYSIERIAENLMREYHRRLKLAKASVKG